MAAKTTLIRDFLYFIKNDLSSNITDPDSSKRPTTSKFVMTSYPERLVHYPIITIKLTNLEARRAGMQVTTQDITLNLEVRIWARNEKEKDSIATDVLNRLANIQFSAGGSELSDFHDLFIGSAVEVDEPGEGDKAGIKSRIFSIVYKFYNTS